MLQPGWLCKIIAYDMGKWMEKKQKGIINVHKNVVYYACVDPLPTDSFTYSSET